MYEQVLLVTSFLYWKKCDLDCCVPVNYREPLNTGHFGDDMNSADSFFVERFSSLGGSKCIVGIILGP